MLKSAIGLTILSLSISIFSFLNQVVIASYFGAGLEFDLFLAASSIPTLISALISSSFSYSLTPHFIITKIHNPQNFNHYLGVFFIKLLIYGSGIFTIAAVALHFSLSSLYPAFEKADHQSLSLINAISWINAFVSIGLGFFTSVFNSNEKFRFPIFLNLIPYLSSIISIYFFNKTLGIVSLPSGLLVGSLVSLLISIYTNKNLLSIKIVEISKYIEINTYFRKLPIIALTMLCFSVYQSVDAYWAPQLGNSNLSYLAYSQRILIVIGNLVIIGPSTVLIPRLSKAIAEHRNQDFLKDILSVIKLILAIASLFAVIGSITANSIIEILFERGNFSHLHTIGVAAILPYMLIGMIFMLCVVMLFRAFFVNTMGNKVAILGIGSSILYFILSGLGVITIGIKGIALAYIITWLTGFFISMTLIFKGSHHSIYNRETLKFIMNQIIILILVALFVSLLNNFITTTKFENHFLKASINLVTCGITGILTYAFLSIRVFRLKEIRNFANAFLLLLKTIRISLVSG